MLEIDDPDLPGLSDLSHDRLCDLTGAQEVALLRLRYRAGKRAILHLLASDGTEQCEGTLWFFKGDKARRLARRNKAARFDPETAALFESFPNDHRMPQIRDFLNRYDSILPDLAEKPPDGAPQLLRYRPGLSCTFRCPVEQQGSIFVKLINDDCPDRLWTANRAMLLHLAKSPVTVAPALGTDMSVSAIAYGAAPGRPLDQVLCADASNAPLMQAIDALRAFWRSPIEPARVMGPDMLLTRAKESASFVGITAPSCTTRIRKLIARLEAAIPRVDMHPIHGDMKLEHLFVDGNRTTLIDTESVSLGPADYDLAQLYGRLWQAEMEGYMPLERVTSASALVRAQSSDAFDWCLDVVALRLAKFYAQRPSPDMSQKINAMLSRLD